MNNFSTNKLLKMGLHTIKKYNGWIFKCQGQDIIWKTPNSQGEKSFLIVSSHYHYNSRCTLALNCMQSGHIKHIMIFKKWNWSPNPNSTTLTKWLSTAHLKRSIQKVNKASVGQFLLKNLNALLFVQCWKFTATLISFLTQTMTF